MLNIFEDVPEENNFYVANGMVIKNINDLYAILDLIDKDTFSKHVNKEKNDFANWILGVYKNEELANSIKKIKKQKAMLSRIRFYIQKEEQEELFIDFLGLNIEKFWAGLIMGFLFGASLATFIIVMFF